MIGSALILIFPFAMAFAAATDLLTMTIPNRVSLALVAAFLVLAPFAGLSWQDILSHLAAGAAVLAVGILLFSTGKFGGGDAKLLAAGALWMGFEQLLPFLTLVSVFGGVLAVGLLAYRRLPAAALPLPVWAERLHVRGGGIPYGIAIAAAALMIYPTTGWYVALAP